MKKKYIEQAAAIPFRNNNGDLKILLITSRNQQKWIVPKGIIEPYQTPEKAALAEAGEEAGIEGILYNDKIGIYYYTKWDSVCRVHVYAMNVRKELSEWDEDYFRKRKWYTVKDAVNKVKSKDLKKFILGKAAGCNPIIGKELIVNNEN